jgi:metal-responsive CopG/Arc/MetJ family transcriptional regulator
MKTAISIPNQVFIAADKIAKKLQMSRSELYTKAISEFVELYQSADITTTLNKVYMKESSSLEQPLSKMQFASIEKEPW